LQRCQSQQQQGTSIFNASVGASLSTQHHEVIPGPKLTRKFFGPLGKCVGHSLELLDIA